jgi:hypothetical protein
MLSYEDIAEKLRDLSVRTDNDAIVASLENIADEISPPEPQPEVLPKSGTAVVFEDGDMGIVFNDGIVYTTPTGEVDIVHWDEDPMTFKPACMLAPDEVPVKIPNTGTKFDYLTLKWHHIRDGKDYGTTETCVYLTGDDIERMESNCGRY